MAEPSDINQKPKLPEAEFNQEIERYMQTIRFAQEAAVLIAGTVKVLKEIQRTGKDTLDDPVFEEFVRRYSFEPEDTEHGNVPLRFAERLISQDKRGLESIRILVGRLKEHRTLSEEQVEEFDGLVAMANRWEAELNTLKVELRQLCEKSPDLVNSEEYKDLFLP